MKVVFNTHQKCCLVVDFIDAEGSIENRLRLCPSIQMSASFLEKKSTEAKHSCAKERVAIPVVIDHRKANNPYLSLYGDDWVLELHPGPILECL